MTWALFGELYGAGAALTLAVICGWNAHAKALRGKERFELISDGDVPVILFELMFWPLSWLIFTAGTIGRATARRTSARLAREAEEKKLLREAGL